MIKSAYERSVIFDAAIWSRTFATAFFALTAMKLCAADLTDLMKRCAPDVHPVTMGALVQHESGGNPYAILDNGNWRLPRKERVLRSYRLKTEAEAVDLANKLIAAGHVIDMGLTQINNRNLKKLGITVEQVFNPCINLQASQAIISNNYMLAMKRYGPGNQALYAALSAYNTGNFVDGFTNGYVHKVLQASALAVPELRIFPASFNQARLSKLASISNRKRVQINPRKSRALEAKLATIEVDIF